MHEFNDVQFRWCGDVVLAEDIIVVAPIAFSCIVNVRPNVSP